MQEIEANVFQIHEQNHIFYRSMGLKLFSIKLIKKGNLTATKIMIAIAFGCTSSVFIYKPTVDEFKKIKQEQEANDKKEYTI